MLPSLWRSLSVTTTSGFGDDELGSSEQLIAGDMAPAERELSTGPVIDSAKDVYKLWVADPLTEGSVL